MDLKVKKEITLDHVPEDIRDAVAKTLTDRLQKHYFNLKHNDWDRHLYCLIMRQLGKPREKLFDELMKVDMEKIPLRKKVKYIQDILNSVVVGFEQGGHALPVYHIINEGGVN